MKKIAISSINVDYGSCIACGSCTKACPPTAWGTPCLRNLYECLPCRLWNCKQANETNPGR